jgi:hypothetical protein
LVRPFLLSYPNSKWELFKQKAISAVIKKPARWYRYVDDIFAVLSH